MMGLLRSEAYRLLSLGFRRPNAALVSALAGAGDFLAELNQQVLIPLSFADDDFWRFVQDVKRRGPDLEASGLLIEYNRLFLGPGALWCPPYGSIYLDGVVAGPSTMETVRLYREAGLRVDPAWKEPPDHIAVELGFMAWLSAEQLRPRRATVRAHRLARIQFEFLRDHLGRWGPLFAERLRRLSSCHIFRFLSAFLSAWLAYDGELLRTAVSNSEAQRGCGSESSLSAPA